MASLLPVSAFAAEESAKTLPTLLIKGEVVSLDSNDPSAVLLKVKDRYGFETPIFLSQDTKIMQGDSTLAASNLTAGSSVEVEYNFDINTAKRHAVSVKVAAPASTAAAPATPAVPVASSELAPDAAVQPAAEPIAPAEMAQPSAPAEAAPATQ